MLDPHVEMVRFALVALVIGVMIFGGTTLTYFLDKHRAERPRLLHAAHVQERTQNAGTGDNADAPRDKAA